MPPPPTSKVLLSGLRTLVLPVCWFHASRTAMPRGFLVKRNRRGAVFYRSHSQSTSERPGTTEEGALNEATRAEKPGLRGVESAESRKDSAGVNEAWSPHIESTLEAEAERRAQLPDTEEEVSVVDVLGLDGDLSCFYAPPPPHGVTLIESCSSVKPVSARLLEHQKHISFTGSCLTSSPVPEVPDLAFLSNPTPTAIPASIERLLGDSSRPFTQPHGITDKYEISHMHVFPPLTLVTPEQQHAARKRSFLQEPHSKHHSKQGNPSKKPKINRKLNFEDEVTTSPVLGLRIKKESPEVRRQRETTSTPTAQPLGEFICQLCKEEYPDPFSLAQHKCSRIVRVEYRCPECDKVFSCPANLASHRRWHKPRPVISQGVETNRVSPLKETRALLQQEEGKENELLRTNLHHGAADSSRSRREQPLLLFHGRSRESPDRNPYRNPSERCGELQQPQMRAADSPPSSLLLRNGDPHERADVLPPPSLTHPHLSNPPFIQALTEEEVYECRYCGKKFRRQAYLKKHLVTHEMSRPTSSYNQKVNGSQSQQVFLCHLCGARFPSVEIRDKHRLWHAMRDELLVETLQGRRADVFHAHADERSPGEGEHQQIFTCKYCPSTFFSSPGLTRHINKTHPTENRQVMRLQMTVRP